MDRTCFSLRAWLHALAMALVVAATLAPTVGAHARLARAEPAADAVVAAAPATVKLWFTEELKTEGTTAEVVDAQGQRVDRGDAKVDLNDPDRKLVVVSLQSDLVHGTYTVRWASVSAEDGDTERGEFQFHIGQRSAPPPAPASAPAVHLHIEAPRDHAEVHGDSVEIVAHLEGGTLAEIGHLHVFVDGHYVMQADDERFTLRGLSGGEHTIKVEFAGRDHFALKPAVEASVRVRVAGSVAAGAPPAAEHGHGTPAATEEHGHEASAPPRRLPRAGGAPLDAALLAGLGLAGAGLALRRVVRR